MTDASVIMVPAVNVDELTVGTKVLCLWRRELYAATIIGIGGEAPKRKFKIHYEGYADKHNTTVKEADALDRLGVYVPADGVQSEPANEPSVASGDAHKPSVDLKRKGGSSEAGRLLSAPSGPKDASAATASSMRHNTHGPAEKRSHTDPAAATLPSTSHTSLHITEQQLVKIPISLQKVLVKDHDAIKVHGKWTKLPARVTVKQILDEYAESLETADLENVAAGSGLPITREKLRESAFEMRQLFDDALPLRFLYNRERPQYEKIAEKMKHEHLERTIAKKATMSELYGLPHLLRALVFVDDFLPETNWSQPVVDNMRTQVNYLLDFLGSKVDLGEYVVDYADFVDGDATGHSDLND